MQKMKLDAESLRVESFAPAENGRDGRGTVAAHGIVIAPPTFPQCIASEACWTKQFEQCHTMEEIWCKCDDHHAPSHDTGCYQTNTDAAHG